jgi:hypothetical protein
MVKFGPYLTYKTAIQIIDHLDTILSVYPEKMRASHTVQIEECILLPNEFNKTAWQTIRTKLTGHK